MDINKWLGERTVYLVEAGSHAYGTNTPESDHDYRGAAIPPKNYFFGLDHFEQANSKETGKTVGLWFWGRLHNGGTSGDISSLVKSEDVVIWSLAKMITLAAAGNPNMIELLFTDYSNIFHMDESVMQPLFDIREAFLSKLLKHRFSGYAMQQLKRMRNHRRWMENPPVEPTRSMYGIEGVNFPKDQIQAAEKLIELQVGEWLVDKTNLSEDIKIQLGPAMVRMVNKVVEQLQLEAHTTQLTAVLKRAANRELGFESDFLNFLSRYKAYRSAKADYKSYLNWKANRNPARAELERKWGYDSKHASHLVRLLRMAREILEGKGVIVKRPDAEELLAIRNGAWSYEEIIEWAEREDQELNKVMVKSSLPQSPNHKLIGQVLAEVTETYLSKE